jgi:hypothetical protein
MKLLVFDHFLIHKNGKFSPFFFLVELEFELMLAKQALCHLGHSISPVLC